MLNTNKRLRSCDACRWRRVKCQRPDTADPTCKSCRDHGIKCTYLRHEASKRKDKRQVPSTALSRRQPIRQEGHDEKRARLEAGASEPSRAPLALSFFDGEGKLAVCEETEAMMFSFLEVYLRFKTAGATHFHLEVLAARFHSAGRRLSQLDVNTETLALACIALGAHMSDHPSLVGADSPRLSDVQQGKCPADLSLYGQRRAGLCRNLKDHVVALVDRRGYFQHTCLESVSVLALTSDVISQISGRHELEICRPYWAAQAGHLATLWDDAEASGDGLDHRPEYTLPFSDAFRSAWTGFRLIIREEVHGEIVQHVNRPRFQPDELRRAARSPFPTEFMAPLRWIWTAIDQLGRAVARRISIPLRQDQPVTLDTFAELLKAHSELWDATMETREQLSVARADLSPAILQQQARYSVESNDPNLQMAPTALGNLLLAILKWWQQWRKAEASAPESGAEPTKLESDVKKLQARIGNSLARAVCFVTEFIEGTEDNALFFAPITPFRFIYWQLPHWVKIAARTPTAEAGGPPCFTQDRQIRAIRALVRAQHAQSWCWPHAEESAKEGDVVLNALLQRIASASADSQGQIDYRRTLSGSPGTPSSAVTSSSSLPSAANLHNSCLHAALGLQPSNTPPSTLDTASYSDSTLVARP